MECHHEDQRGGEPGEPPLREQLKLGLSCLEREGLWEPHSTIPVLKGQLHRRMSLFMTETT